MSAFSGRKQSASKARDFLPEFATEEITINIGGKPRSIKKYLPVRISTAYLDNPLSSRKLSSNDQTLGLSNRKPIRNLHKLLESPKRNARKRLDNLYDSKSKESIVPLWVKPQTCSAKKLASKAPVIINNTNNKTDATTPAIKCTKKSRQSRLLPPGTITGSYVSGRSSLATRNSIHQPGNGRVTISHVDLQPKRPSDVAEESPQSLESSDNLSNNIEKLVLDNDIAKKPNMSSEKIEVPKETILISDFKDEKEKSTHRQKITSSSVENIAENSPTGNNTEDDSVMQRPTVIISHENVASRTIVEDFDELIQVDIQDGSYSEILRIQPFANNSETDESLLFRHTEQACTQLENQTELHYGDITTEIIFKMIDMNDEMLNKYKTRLTESISEQEKNLQSMRILLEIVNGQIAGQKKLESRIKLEGISNLNSEELSVIFCQNVRSDGRRNPRASDQCQSSFKENSELPNGRVQSKTFKQIKTRQSKNYSEPHSEKNPESNQSNSVLKELNRRGIEIENLENKPPQRRRSARLANRTADLLSPVDKSTPAVTKNKFQTKSKPCTPSMTATPVRTAKWGRRSERPLREYMVLKSAIKFLKTPDSRRYQIGSDEKVKIPDSVDKSQDAILTDKLLKEFHELYSTP